MNLRNLGQSDIKISPILMGTWQEDLAAMDRISRRVTEQLDDNPVLWKW